MTRKILALVLCLCMALTLSAAVAETTALDLTDMMGREVTLAGPAQRIVVLAASDCEILYALGAGDQIVGRGTYCDYPAEAAEKPAVDSGSEMNIEQILALEPDVVVMPTMNQTVEQNDALENAGVKVIVSNAQDIAGTYEAIALLGRVCGRDAEAAALVDSMKAAFEQIAAESTASGKTVYFEVSPLEWGLWTAGSGTFMDELAQLCGLTNAFADVTGWAEISQEQVLERDPDYIVTISMYYGEGPTPVEEIAGRTGWEQLKAVASGAICNADSNSVSRPGPRLVDAAQELSDFVNGVTAEVPAA